MLCVATGMTSHVVDLVHTLEALSEEFAIPTVTSRELSCGTKHLYLYKRNPMGPTMELFAYMVNSAREWDPL